MKYQEMKRQRLKLEIEAFLKITILIGASGFIMYAALIAHCNALGN